MQLFPKYSDNYGTMMNTWDLICFDLDDTLIDYERTFQAAIHHCFTTFFGQQFDFSSWFITFKQCCDRYWNDYACRRLTRTEYRRLRFLETMSVYNRKADHQMADAFQDYFDQVVGRFSVPVDGLIPLLHWLRNRSVPLGVITNGTGRIQREKLYYAGLHPFFSDEAIIISEEVGMKKPDRAIFSYAKQQLAPHCDQPLFIGDSWELDVVGALRANWQAVYFNPRQNAPTTFHQPVAVCNNVNELLVLLREPPDEGKG